VVAKCIAADIARFFVEESCLCDMNNEYLQSWVDNDSQLGRWPAAVLHKMITRGVLFSLRY
jgi:hypothetical protein